MNRECYKILRSYLNLKIEKVILEKFKNYFDYFKILNKLFMKKGWKLFSISYSVILIPFF